MRVRQLVGKYAGQILEFPYQTAMDCIDAGTAEKIDSSGPEVAPVRGSRVDQSEGRVQVRKPRRISRRR